MDFRIYFSRLKEKYELLVTFFFLVLKVLFSCGSSDGTYLVAAEARRKLDMNNTIFCLRIPSIGVLLHPKHPDTTFYTQSNSKYIVTRLYITGIHT